MGKTQVIFLDLIEQTSKDNKSTEVTEVLNYRDALRYGVDNINEGKPSFKVTPTILECFLRPPTKYYEIILYYYFLTTLKMIVDCIAGVFHF